MIERGFIEEAHNPVNVVQTPVGLTTIDNTRIAVALELGLEDVPVVIHQFDDPLPENMVRIRRFGDARTWGDALLYRTEQQRPDPLPPYGIFEKPVMPD